MCYFDRDGGQEREQEGEEQEVEEEEGGDAALFSQRQLCNNFYPAGGVVFRAVSQD